MPLNTVYINTLSVYERLKSELLLCAEVKTISFGLPLYWWFAKNYAQFKYIQKEHTQNSWSGREKINKSLNICSVHNNKLQIEVQI